MLSIDVQFAEGIERIDLTSIRSIITALDQEKSIKVPAKAVINVRVVNQAKIREYNRRFAGKDEATDVLSFNYSETRPRYVDELGDVVISYQHALKQAKAADTEEATELALLVLHGILHILGYDHQNLAAREKIDKLQTKIMTGAGLTYRNFGWKS